MSDFLGGPAQKEVQKLNRRASVFGGGGEESRQLPLGEAGLREEWGEAGKRWKDSVPPLQPGRRSPSPPLASREEPRCVAR